MEKFEFIDMIVDNLDAAIYDSFNVHADTDIYVDTNTAAYSIVLQADDIKITIEYD